MESFVKTRKPAVAGSFYPDNHDELNLMLANFYAKTETIVSNKHIRALISPHAGLIYSGLSAAWGYKQLPSNLRNNHFVLIGPSHHYPYEGIACSSSSYWETPLGKVTHQPIKNPSRQIFIDEKPHIPEHCLEVQLPFLQYLYRQFSLTCLLTGSQLDWKKTAEFLSDTYLSSIFIFSSDLSHYLPQDFAILKDKKTIDSILTGNTGYFLSEENTACGMMGILILLEMARRKNWQCKLIHYDTSVNISSDKSAVVGYAAIGYYK